MSIAVEELAACGARTMIRVGSCAAISDRLPVGALMVAMAAVCDEGTSRYYAPPNFPPVAARRVVNALVDAASAGHRPSRSGSPAAPTASTKESGSPSIIELWRGLGVLTFEMETSCLFTVAAKLGLEAGSIVCVGSNLLTGEATYQGVGLDDFNTGQERMLRSRPRRRQRPGRRPVSATLLLRGGTIVTVTDGVVDGDVYVEDGRIAAVGTAPASADDVVDVRGMLVLPGFVQAHVHLCQTLAARPAPTISTSSTGCASACGRSSSLTTRRRWPPRPSSACAELLLGGTTSVLSWTPCTTPTR